MALNNMATDYTSKVVIFNHEGMEALIRGMSESDPDVQRNSVEAISSLLQVNTMFRVYNTMPL